jgi:hypothetical protein
MERRESAKRFGIDAARAREAFMRTPRTLCWFLLLALLAGFRVGRAQTTPAYRPPVRPAVSSQSTPSSPAAGSSQCAGGAAPTGATAVNRGNGTVPAPRGAQTSYSQTSLNLANYAVDGRLTIQITVGNGGSPATFELFPANTTFSSNGAPSARPLASATNVAAGGCATLTYNFSQAGSFILAVTGASGSNTFQYSAYVEPSFAGLFQSTPSYKPPAASAAQPTQSPSAPSTQPSQSGSPAQPATAPSAANQGPSIFNGVFPTAPASQPATGQPASSAQSASTQAAPQAVSPASQAQSPAQAQQPASPSPSSPAPAQAASPSSVNTPLMLQSVSIQNSPGVPDTGGHCIICGLVTGNLTAVEPNLVICVTPSGRTGAARSCTGICNPGHDCHAPLDSQVMLPASSHAVHVEVLDNDKEGKVTPLAAFDEMDATQCTAAQPCKVDDADDQAAGTLVSFEFGDPCATAGSASGSIGEAGPVLVASTIFPAGLLPAQVNRSSRQGCVIPDFTFTSYSELISSQQLFQAFMSLYQGSDSFKTLMNGLLSNHTTVNVVIVYPKYKQWSDVVAKAALAYQYFNANNPGANYKSPVAFAFAYTEPSDRSGEYDVIISDDFLAQGYYPGWAPQKGYMGTERQVLPIELTLTYELASNVVGWSANPNFQENAYQTLTNCIMEQAFPNFVPNGSNDTPQNTKGVAKYDSYATSAVLLPIDSTTAPHGIVVQPPPVGVNFAKVCPSYCAQTSSDPSPEQVQTYYFSTRKPGRSLESLSFAKQSAGQSAAAVSLQKQAKNVNEVGPTTCVLPADQAPFLAQMDGSGDDGRFKQKSGIIHVDQDFSNTNSSNVNQQNQQPENQENPQQDNSQKNTENCNFTNYFCANSAPK